MSETMSTGLDCGAMVIKVSMDLLILCIDVEGWKGDSLFEYELAWLILKKEKKETRRLLNVAVTVELNLN